MRYEPRNFYLRSTEEMEELFSAYPDAVANTQRIADRCRMEFTFGKYHLPEFKLPEGVTIAGAGVTGYGEELIKRALETDIGEVETMAHYRGAKHFLPDVTTILDIGGQDMKCCRIKDGAVDDILLSTSETPGTFDATECQKTVL